MIQKCRFQCTRMFNLALIFLPETIVGLQVLSLPACVCVSVNHELVRVIIHDPFKLVSPNLDQKMQSILLKVPIVFGADWTQSSSSNLTSFQHPVYLHRFCLQKRTKTESVPHPKWQRTYKFAHMVVWWTVEQSSCIFSVTIAGFPVLDSAIGNGFWNASVGFRQSIHISYAEILYANVR